MEMVERSPRVARAPTRRPGRASTSGAVSRLRRAAGLFALATCVGLGSPHPAVAHGNTIRVSYRGVKPVRLVVVAGTTVHFHNANSSGAVCTVVIDGDIAESPPLSRSEGWHFTFDSPGEYHFFVKEYPSRTGEVVVVAAP